MVPAFRHVFFHRRTGHAVAGRQLLDGAHGRGLCRHWLVSAPSRGIAHHVAGQWRAPRTGSVALRVGGNFGTSVGPLLVALIVAPHGMGNVAWFVVVSMLAFVAMVPICRWYSAYLTNLKTGAAAIRPRVPRPLPMGRTVFTIFIIMLLIFSKYIYMASLTNYYTFYLIHRFGVSVQMSQVLLFVFLVAMAIGTVVGGPVGDRYGRKTVIWVSILGCAPFSLLMPHVGLEATVLCSFGAGLMLSSAFPAILLYARELLPNKLGMVSGLFFGFAFGVAGIASAILGSLADTYGIEAIYSFCAYTPLLGVVAFMLPSTKKR